MPRSFQPKSSAMINTILGRSFCACKADTNIHPPANIGKYKCLIRLFFLWILNKLSIFSYINPELF